MFDPAFSVRVVWWMHNKLKVLVMVVHKNNKDDFTLSFHNLCLISNISIIPGLSQGKLNTGVSFICAHTSPILYQFIISDELTNPRRCGWTNHKSVKLVKDKKAYFRSIYNINCSHIFNITKTKSMSIKMFPNLKQLKNVNLQVREEHELISIKQKPFISQTHVLP